jgi:hypothetical protein
VHGNDAFDYEATERTHTSLLDRIAPIDTQIDTPTTEGRNSRAASNNNAFLTSLHAVGSLSSLKRRVDALQGLDSDLAAPPAAAVDARLYLHGLANAMKPPPSTRVSQKSL